MKDSGYVNGSFLDYSPHLVHYFQGMVDQINNHKDSMMSEGVTEAYLAKWNESLTSRVDIQKNHSVTF